ncbi:Flp pilus assembly protein CpaB [Haloimpatiens sp. FM7330]|uniref:Flp pilus assembly protein CpaB n=1 Tax=Haloimpatiens sp. FM7330 TaxID=3298610 RepID=UPI00362F078A
MKNIGVKLIAVSFIIAVLAAGAVFMYLQSLGNKKETIQKSTILVAAETIPPRTRIEYKMIKEVEIVDNSIFDSYIKNVSDIIGKYPKETILKNQGFHNSKLISKNENELSLKIDNNHRAISINVTGSSAVSDLIKPGDFVDIIVYLPEKKEGNSVVRPDLSKIVLENVKLLAVDKQLNREEKLKDDRSKEAEKVATNFLVTLSVPISKIENLVLAERIGNLKLVLRPITNEKSTQTKGATWEELIVEKVEKQTVQEDKKNTRSEEKSDKYVVYTVKRGDTLRKISKAFYGDSKKYSLIKEANNMQNENIIITGTIIKIPVLDY